MPTAESAVLPFALLPSGLYAWRAWIADGGLVGAPRGHLEVSVGNQHLQSGGWVTYFSFDPKDSLWSVPRTRVNGKESYGAHELLAALLTGIPALRGEDPRALADALSDPAGLIAVLEVMSH